MYVIQISKSAVLLLNTNTIWSCLTPLPNCVFCKDYTHHHHFWSNYVVYVGVEDFTAEEVEAEDTCKFLAQTTVAVVEEYFTSETTEEEVTEPVGIGECLTNIWFQVLSISLNVLTYNSSLSWYPVWRLTLQWH